MDRMFRVLGFWTLAIALMALAGNFIPMALMFLFQTVVFVLLSYMKLTEKTYMLLFWGYMLVAITGFTYWSYFQMSV